MIPPDRQAVDEFILMLRTSPGLSIGQFISPKLLASSATGILFPIAIERGAEPPKHRTWWVTTDGFGGLGALIMLQRFSSFAGILPQRQYSGDDV